MNSAEIKLMKSPFPFSIKRGDVLAFHISQSARIPWIQASSIYVLVYCGQKFSKGETIKVSDSDLQLNLVMWFRMHVISPVFLEIPIKFALPRVYSVVYKVSRKSSSDSEIVRATVPVQV